MGKTGTVAGSDLGVTKRQRVGTRKGSGIPLSWHKAALDTSLVWIGWSIDVLSWTIQVADEKLSKILDQVRAVMSVKKVPLKDLQALVGRLPWLTTAWHQLRPLLIPLYKAIQQIPLTMVGVDHAIFSELAVHLDDNLSLQSSMASRHHSLITGVRVQRVANTFVKTKAGAGRLCSISASLAGHHRSHISLSFGGW